MTYYISGVDQSFDDVWNAISHYEDIVGSDYNNEDISSEEWFYDLCCDDIWGEDEQGNTIPFKELNT
jgi:hypothetical protein